MNYSHEVTHWIFTPKNQIFLKQIAESCLSTYLDLLFSTQWERALLDKECGDVFFCLKKKKCWMDLIIVESVTVSCD